MENSCKYFRWRDLEEIDMRSKSVIPRLANRIKELEEALQFYKSKEKMKLLEKKGDQVCHDKLIKKKKMMKCSILNWKLIIVFVAVFFLILGINKNVNAGNVVVCHWNCLSCYLLFSFMFGCVIHWKFVVVTLFSGLRQAYLVV
ncbi:hypothetical protein MTR67_012915 [Solanum verrucosum]|uniref:Uncharacterized protein n=1 Tax=Solanum verrucosum TaxID=315347 RepID=A0AAF0QDZ9_SOLVR|nr:hypothetical protein MTR67_012915 [Solanum verrucosum]